MSEEVGRGRQAQRTRISFPLVMALLMIIHGTLMTPYVSSLDSPPFRYTHPYQYLGLVFLGYAIAITVYRAKINEKLTWPAMLLTLLGFLLSGLLFMFKLEVLHIFIGLAGLSLAILGHTIKIKYPTPSFLLFVLPLLSAISFFMSANDAIEHNALVLSAIFLLLGALLLFLVDRVRTSKPTETETRQ